MRLSRLRRGQERYYLQTVANGHEDHRANGLEPDGAWLGQGAASLGLGGRVDGAPLAAVLDGADPGTGERLSPTHKRVQVVALDLTFAAPKQVSLLFGLGSAGTASETMTCHQAAVAASVGYLERRAVWARRQRQGERWAVPTGGVTAAAFLHRTSRMADPHVHTHVLVANLVHGADGRWSALDSRSLYAHAAAAGWLYGAHLRAEVSRRLGVEFVADADGRFVIAGMDPRLTPAFSQRRVQVESRLAAWGAAGEAAAQAAALATRPEKDLDRSPQELERWWHERARGMGMGAEGADRFVGRLARGGPRRLELEELAPRVLGPGGPLAGRASFSRPELLRALCGVLASGADVATVEGLADSLLTSDRVVRRGGPGDPGSGPVAPGQIWRMSGRSGGPGGAERWVVSTISRAEESTLARADAARRDALGPDAAGRWGQGSAAVPHTGGHEPTVERVLDRRPGLSPLERAAVRTLAATVGGVVVLDGPAGSHHDVLDAAREVWEAAGRRILGTATDRADAAQLAALTGIRSVGLGALLSGPGSSPNQQAQKQQAQKQQARNQQGLQATVIVVTAAEALDHRQLDQLLDASEEATLVLAGRLSGRPGHEDTIVGRLAHRHGAISLGPAASLGLQGPAKQAAPATTQDVLEGSRPALAGEELTVSLSDGGSVTFSQTAPAARARIVDDWLTASRPEGGRPESGRPEGGQPAFRPPAVAMVAGKAEAERLNALARGRLSSQGRLGEIVAVRPQPLAVGEQMVARWGSVRSGLSAGERVTVEGLDPLARRLALRTGDARSLTVPLRDVERGQLAYAYALSPADAARVAPACLLVLGTAEGFVSAPGPDRGHRSNELHYYTVAGAELFRGADRTLAGDRPGQPLSNAVEVAAPPSVMALIGPAPDDPSARAVWRRAAAAIEGFRLRWGQELSDVATPRPRAAEPGEARENPASSSVAHGPDDLRRVVDRADALALVRTARQRLGIDRDREPPLRAATLGSSLERRPQTLEPGRELGLDVEREGAGLSR